MELRHLKLVITVDKEGTLSKAAEKLHLTQSALSHQLKEIEEELGMLMFNRVKKRLVISDAGRTIRDTGLKIHSDLELAKGKLKKQMNGQQGSVKLSTECYTCYHWLPEVMNRFQNDFQQIEVEILPEFTKNHFEGLMNEQVDLVITSLKSNNENLDYEDLFQDEQLAIVANGHPWASKSFVELEEFKSENLIIYQKPIEEVTFYKHFLKPNGIIPNKIIEIRLTEAAIQMAKNDFGVKVMAKWAAAPYVEKGDVASIKITENGIYRKWYLAYNKSAGWKPHYNHFKKHLVESMRHSFVELID